MINRNKLFALVAEHADAYDHLGPHAVWTNGSNAASMVFQGFQGFATNSWILDDIDNSRIRYVSYFYNSYCMYI